jgi:hypothetical protein
MTGFALAMWIVWGLLVLILAVLYIYRSKLTQDEDDQIILDESFDNVKNEQAAIVAKVNRIQPAVRVLQWLVLVATVIMVGYYIYWDILVNFHLIG